MPGLAEKLTVLPLSLFMFGWVLYTIGFAFLLKINDPDSPGTGPTISPFYLTLVGGPFVFGLGLLHAIRSSSIFGALSAVLNSFYFTTAGFVLIYSDLSDSMVVMLTGSLIEGLGWCLVLIFSMFYKYPSQRQERSIVDQSPRRQGARRPFTPGIARILSIPCVILSFVGWCVFIAGLLYEINYFFYQSAIFYIPPLLYLAALLHAGCSGGASTVMGVFASILSVLYFYFIGGEVTNAAVQFSLTLELGGGIVSLIFYSCTLVLWPFYRKHPPTYYEVPNTQYTSNASDRQSNVGEVEPLTGEPPQYGAVN